MTRQVVEAGSGSFLPATRMTSWRMQALIDRPDETRRVINFKRLALTDLKIDIPRIAKKKVLKEAYESGGDCS